jgi:hypothetical protein
MLHERTGYADLCTQDVRVICGCALILWPYMRALLLQVRTQYANLVHSQSLRLYNSALAACVYLVHQLSACICIMW